MLAMIETHFSNHGKTGMIETTRILCRKSCEIILPALYAIVKRKGEENLDVSRRLNAAIEYVEQHITEELDYQKLAQLAGCSAYNFQRMFSFIADLSLVEYVRRRRLTLAALELQQSGVKVIDLALKYGYDSPVSFARAFQAFHGVTPSEAKKSNVSLRLFPPITFQITIQGVGEMNYRIVKTEPFQLLGIEGLISTVGDETYYASAGEMWNANHQSGLYEKLFADAGAVQLPIYDTMFTQAMCRIHGIMNYRKVDDTTYPYMQCSFVTPDSRTEGYTIVEVPAATWAVFPAEIPDWNMAEPMDRLYKRFYQEWLPASEFEKTDGPEMEMYGGTPQKGYVELWMPVSRKK